MGASATSRGLLASLRMAFSCFPAARDKSKPSEPTEDDFQCAPCGVRKTKTTIIVGGGVTGLGTAYWLSRMSKTQQQQVIVLEARNQCFQGASGHNSGLLSRHWFSGSLRQLADHSFAIYRDLAREQPDFRHICDYHENSLFQAHCGQGPTDSRAPCWMKLAEGWHLESEPALRATRQDQVGGSGIWENNPSSATMYVLTQSS